MPRHVAHHGVALEASLTRAIPLLLLALLLPSGCDGGDTDPTGSDTDTDTDTDTLPDPGDPVVVVEGAFMLALGETATLTARTVNASDENYTWATSDPQVLTISDDGEVSAVGLGSATITATGDSTDLQGELGITVTQEVPYLEAWSLSGHADRSAEAFRHWDEEPDIPATCAGCHSRPGFLDRIGADGSTPDVVDSAHPQGSVVDCQTCHHPDASSLDHVVFPSGVRVGGLDEGARCMTCHQGRSSSDDVEAAIAEAGVDADTVSEDLGFINIHYYAAGATLFAGEVRGGAQYEGQVYDWRFRHVDTADTCIGCHDQHSLELRIDECSECHTDVAKAEDVKDVRMIASQSSDYDGDGDTSEGVYYEIEGLKEEVYDSLQQYVVDQGQTAICWANAYPYFFQDTDGDGTCSSAEADFANSYGSWSARSLSAAYNYQLASKDPGNYAHNAKYTIQLLHDSLQDLNLGLTSPKDLSAFDRDDPGHFNGAGEAARHWDENEAVSASCSKCHAGQAGLEFYLEYGVGLQGGAPDNGLECQTCHVGLPDFTQMRDVADVTFPSGITLASDTTSNLCMTCHSGREAKVTVDARLDSSGPRFVNVHYRAAGATKFGTDAQVGYEYDGKTYASEWTTHIGGNGCTDCHDPVASDHSFQIEDAFATCQVCHAGAADVHDIRSATTHGVDYDGDGSATEPLADELATMADAVIGTANAQAGLCLGEGYPYFFVDDDASGPICDPGEETRFNGWTPALTKAIFNYQFWRTEPGAWSHNFDYMGQLLFDSAEDLDPASVSTWTRP